MDRLWKLKNKIKVMEKVTINGKEYQIDIDKCKEQGLLVEEDVYPKDIYELCKFEKAKGTVYLDNCNIWHKGENLKDLFHKNWFTNIDETKAFNALRKLIQLRDWWWDNMCDGWRPNWNSQVESKWTINTYIGEIITSSYVVCSKILAFPTSEIRDKFYEAYKDLIEEAKIFL